MKIINFQEKVLFGRIKSKDKRAFIKVYDLYVDKIYRFIYFKISNSDDAHDLTSTVFLKAWNHIQNNSVTDSKTLNSLIYRIARNLVIDYYRQNSNKQQVSLEGNQEYLGNDSKMIDEKQDLQKKVEISSEIRSLEKKLQKLKNEYREVIMLRHVEELSVGEIAEILDIKKGNVRVLLHRAIKALKNQKN